MVLLPDHPTGNAIVTVAEMRNLLPAAHKRLISFSNSPPAWNGYLALTLLISISPNLTPMLMKAILTLLFAVVLLSSQSFAAEPSKPLEPTNAAEAAARKDAEDAATETQYQALVATLPPDQQAWERTLQENLGNNFYLPIH